ncbi:MAG: RNA methyltransferase [Paludibacteraceae bacterium]|nr:RNA methyltransferase [Paludibacteraceae bacterium]
MPVLPILQLSDPGLEPYARLSERQLSEGKLTGRGLFIAEGEKVIRVALNAGCEPVSLLMDEQQLLEGGRAMAALYADQWPEVPVYVGSRSQLKQLSGFDLSRGIMGVMRRRSQPALQQVLATARRVAVIDGVVEATNVGAIFRSAAALDIDAVLVTSNSCDPLNRRALRVSMGNVLLEPWAWLETDGSGCYQSQLRELGFATAALALTDRSISIDDPVLRRQERLALILGTEGEGLPRDTIETADFTVKIPMAHGVDSLNVAAASAVAFWQLRAR